MQTPVSGESNQIESGLFVRRGFTLVELLVSVSVVALLLGIVLPVLQNARDSGRRTVCVSNMRGIAVGWNLYLNDNRYFPYERDFDFDGRADDLRPYHVWDWGGVNWYSSETGDDPVYNEMVTHRPLNSYLGAPSHLTEHFDLFRCPADDGLKYSETIPYFSDDHYEKSEAQQDFGLSMYGVRGTSYHANEWIWVKPGAVEGFPLPHLERAPNFTSKNGRSKVEMPSQFPLVGDAGSFQAGRMGEDRFAIGLYLNNQFVEGSWYYSWWHGVQNCNMAFLDGSAKSVRMTANRGVTKDYSIWVKPSLHQVPGGSATHAYASNVPGKRTTQGWDPGVLGPAEESDE